LYLGDLLVAIPAFRALWHAFPAAEISYVGLPWAQGLISRYGYVDRFLEFPGYPGIPEVEVVTERTAAFFEAAATYGYDLAVQLHGDGRRMNGFVGGLRARWSLGYDVPGAPDPPSFALPYPGDDAHEVLKFVALLGRIGVDPLGTHLELPLLDSDQADLATIPGADRLGAARPLVGIHPGASAPSRRWAAERFGALGKILQEELGAQIVVLGGP